MRVGHKPFTQADGSTLQNAARAISNVMLADRSKLPGEWGSAVSGTFVDQDTVEIRYRRESLNLVHNDKQENQACQVLEKWVREQLAANPALKQYANVSIRLASPPADNA